MNETSKIELLTRTLEFYAKEENHLPGGFVSTDKGGMARGVLDILKKTDGVMEEMKSEYEEYIKDIEPSEVSEEVIALIKQNFTRNK